MCGAGTTYRNASSHTDGNLLTNHAFAALKSDGSLVTWGRASAGGDSSSVADDLRSGVSKIYWNSLSFAALKTDGSVVTWGDPRYGGSIPQEKSTELSSGVKEIFSTNFAFAALKDDGSVITWGIWGGDSSSVADKLSSGVKEIFSTAGAFAAIVKSSEE